MNLSPAALQQKGCFVRLKSQYCLQYVCDKDHVSIYNNSENIEINSVEVSHRYVDNRLPAQQSAIQHQIKNLMHMQEDLIMCDVHD